MACMSEPPLSPRPITATLCRRPLIVLGYFAHPLTLAPFQERLPGEYADVSGSIPQIVLVKGGGHHGAARLRRRGISRRRGMAGGTATSGDDRRPRRAAAGTAFAAARGWSVRDRMHR